MRRQAFLFAGLLTVTILLEVAPAAAQSSEVAVKAAFLTRFARYVTWPPLARPAAAQPFQLCVIGVDPFGNTLEQNVTGQGVDGHPFVIRRMSLPSEASGCHVAFVQGQDGQATGQLLAGLSGLPILTVTDARTGSQRGMIHFLISSGRVRFFIDDTSASERGISISSRLLALAVGVKQTRG